MRYEKELLAPVRSLIRERGYDLDYPELPFFDHRVDLYAYSQMNRSTIAIELKLKRWKKAIKQAALYQLCADYAMIALPEKSVRLVSFDLLSDFGIGLISVEDDYTPKVVLESVYSSEVRDSYKNEYVELMQSGVLV